MWIYYRNLPVTVDTCMEMVLAQGIWYIHNLLWNLPASLLQCLELAYPRAFFLLQAVMYKGTKKASAFESCQMSCGMLITTYVKTGSNTNIAHLLFSPYLSHHAMQLFYIVDCPQPNHRTVRLKVVTYMEMVLALGIYMVHTIVIWDCVAVILNMFCEFVSLTKLLECEPPKRFRWMLHTFWYICKLNWMFYPWTVHKCWEQGSCSFKSETLKA